MKQVFAPDHLPERALFLACSSHEDRCLGVVSRSPDWRPLSTVLFHYDDPNPKRDENHALMLTLMQSASMGPTELKFTERRAAQSLRESMHELRARLDSRSIESIVLDISVFTRRHLFMLLRFLDDAGFWDRLTIVYSEPDEYDVSQYVPLSFGLSSIQQVPGFSACPDLSRPVHLALFLNYEGDRALAVHDHVQPMLTTLIVPDPPTKPAWRGRTENFNTDLLSAVDPGRIERVDPVDPEDTRRALSRIMGDSARRGLQARMICPLGTKPQAVGAYSYIRESLDPPAIIYGSPLRHNHEYYSHGLGASWMIRRGLAP